MKYQILKSSIIISLLVVFCLVIMPLTIISLFDNEEEPQQPLSKKGQSIYRNI